MVFWKAVALGPGIVGDDGGGALADRRNDGCESGHRGIEIVVDQQIIVMTPVAHFGAGIEEPAFDDFFVVGGDSLLASRVVWNLADALGVEVSIRTFFAGPTVSELAAHVAASDEPIDADTATEEGMEPADDSGILAAGKTLINDIGGLVKYKNLEAPLQPSLDDQARFSYRRQFNNPDPV